MSEIDSAGDQQMIDAVFNRSEQGLHDMARTYGSLLHTVSMNLLHDAADAEECVNDTWLRVWNTIPPYRPTYLRSFLCKITRQIALDRYRADHRQKRGGDNAGLWIEWDEDVMPTAAADDDPLESFAGIGDAVERFLAERDVESRVLFTRRYFFGESLQSLAERYEKNPKILAVKMARLRNQLKKYLEKEGFYL